MKKQILFLLMIFSVLISCKKEYQCSCSDSKCGELYAGCGSCTPFLHISTVTLTIETKPLTKGDARSACKNFNGSSDPHLFPDSNCDSYTLAGCAIVE